MSMLRTAWLVAGLICLGLGFVGAVLPLLPTTVFMLAAAFCFARSSPALHGWLTEHPTFGPPLAAWRTHGAVSRRAKRASLCIMALALLATWWSGLSGAVLAAQAAVMAVVSVFLLTRPEPPDV